MNFIYVGRRNQPFGERNIVVRQEDDLEPSAYRRVAIDRAGQIVDEFDDQLGQAIGGRRLAGEEKRPRQHFETRVFPQPIVENDDAQRVQQLTLVFVNALDLAVEDGVRIDSHTRGRF